MQTIIYKFLHASEIYADTFGNFYRHSDHKPLPKIYHAGRIAVRDKAKIYGIKRLRKNAVKAVIEIPDIPF